MDEDPRADIVSGQYEHWMYPEPIEDLPGWLAGNWQWFDPSHAHRMFWPNRDYQPRMDILIAGCGTNQGAVFAYNNPGARVVAIDVSKPSLDHHRHLKEKYGMQNLETHLLPIEEVGTLRQDFDLVVSTGVLHHLAEPELGLTALAKCLRPDGVMALMLYARYGRIGVELMQSLFRDLGFQQNEASVALVAEALACLPESHPIKSYLVTAPDVSFDAGLVDTFLHGRDHSYTVGDCLELVDSAGLVFQEWFIKSPYEPAPASDNQFLRLVASLPDAERWSVMERINTQNACHFFTACHPDRPPGGYRIDFASPPALDYVPVFRVRCALAGDQVVRPGWSIPLTGEQQVLLRGVDGRRSIREILLRADQEIGDQPNFITSPDDLRLSFFRSLWQRDFLSMALATS